MQLSFITLNEYGQVTCTDETGYELFLQLPITCDRTLAHLCYAGGKEYKSYTTNGDTYITDTGDEFVEHPYAEYLNVEVYTKKPFSGQPTNQPTNQPTS